MLFTFFSRKIIQNDMYMNLTGGTVRIYAESDKLEPIASVFDPIVLPVNYVSFCGYDNLVRFYYDCSGQY